MNIFRLSFILLLMGIIPLSGCHRADGDGDGGGKAKGRTPTFKYEKKKEGGCADVYLYKMTADEREVLVVRADKKKLKLPDKGSVTFDLAKAPDGLVVEVDLWEKAPRFR